MGWMKTECRDKDERPTPHDFHKDCFQNFTTATLESGANIRCPNCRYYLKDNPNPGPGIYGVEDSIRYSQWVADQHANQPQLTPTPEPAASQVNPNSGPGKHWLASQYGLGWLFG